MRSFIVLSLLAAPFSIAIADPAEDGANDVFEGAVRQVEALHETQTPVQRVLTEPVVNEVREQFDAQDTRPSILERAQSAYETYTRGSQPQADTTAPEPE